MLRLTDIALPLNHAESALTDAILAKLNLPATDLKGVHVFKRGVDARRKTNIQLIYTLDIELTPETEQRLLAAGNPMCDQPPIPPINMSPARRSCLSSGPWWWALAPAGFSSPCC